MGIFDWYWKWREIGPYRKCIFCGNREPEKEIGWGIYSGYKQYYYHQDCLEQIINHPQIHEHQAVDMALRILEELADIAQRKKDRKERFYLACEKIREYKRKL